MPDTSFLDKPSSPSLISLAGAYLLAPVWDIYAALALRHGGQPLTRPLRRSLVSTVALILAIVGIPPLWRRLPQPGPFGFLSSGLVGLHLRGGDACCAMSRILSPGEPVLTLITARLPNSLGLLLLTVTFSLALALLIVLFISTIRRFSHQHRWLGSLMESLVWISVSGLAAPVGALLLIGTLVGGTHFHFFAAHPLALLPAASSAAMLPGLIIALQILAEGSSLSSWRSKALLACRAIYQQTGWILSSLIIVEVVGARKGVGRLLFDALRVQDAPIFISIMGLFALVLFLANTHMVWVTAVLGLGIVERDQTITRAEATVRQRVVVGVAGAILTVSIAGLAGIITGPSIPDPAHMYAQRSPEHRLGTATFGQDVQAQIAHNTLSLLTAMLAGGLALTALGSLWGMAAATLRSWHHPVGGWLADLVLLPAQAAILLHPALIPLLLIVSPNPVGAGVVVGLLLAPRLSLAVDDRLTKNRAGLLQIEQPLRWTGGLFSGALWGVLQYRYAAGMLAVSPVTASGSPMVSAFREWIAAGLTAPDGRFAWLALASALPGIILGWGLFCLYLAHSSQPTEPQTDWLLPLLG